MCNTSQAPAHGVMRVVPSRSAATLLPIIQQHVRAGNTVYVMSGQHMHTSNCVQQLPPVNPHSVMSHTLHYVDPAREIHTQNIESYWNRVKEKLKWMKVIRESMIYILVPRRLHAFTIAWVHR